MRLMGVYIEKLEIEDRTCHKRRRLPHHVSRYILHHEYQGEVLCLVESKKGWMDWELERGSSAILLKQ